MRSVLRMEFFKHDNDLHYVLKVLESRPNSRSQKYNKTTMDFNISREWHLWWTRNPWNMIWILTTLWRCLNIFRSHNLKSMKNDKELYYVWEIPSLLKMNSLNNHNDFHYFYYMFWVHIDLVKCIAECEMLTYPTSY